MEINLVEIGIDGIPTAEIQLTALAQSVCEQCAAGYRKSGYVRPWIAYLAVQDSQIVGSCAFKSAPNSGRVEIA